MKRPSPLTPRSARSTPQRRLDACALLWAGCTGLAQAQSSPWFVAASAGFLHDTNFLRLSEGQSPPSGYTRSDTGMTTSLAAGFDQMIGRQRLYANATLRSTRLANNSVFDSQGYGVQAGLAWEASRRFSGELRAISERTLTTFDPGPSNIIIGNNLQTISQVDTVFRAGLVTTLSAEVGVGGRDVSYSNSLYDSREFRETYTLAGLRYRPSSVSSIGVAARNTRGTYPRYRVLADGTFQSNDYRGQFVDLTATYRGSGKTELRGRVSSGRTRYDSATQSDFSGVTTAIDWIWEATGRLLFETTLSREPSQDAYFLSTDPTVRPLEFSRVATGLRVRANYALSPRFGLRASLGSTHRSLEQSLPLAGGAVSTISGNDTTSVFTLGAAWTPVRWLSLGCDVGREMRRGEAPLSSDMSNGSISCNVKAELR